MPYIEQARRKAIFHDARPLNCGELNFKLTCTLLIVRPWSSDTRTELLKICRQYLEDRANDADPKVVAESGELVKTGTKYQHINDVLGALDGMAREYGRRCIMGYPIAQVLRESVASAIYAEIAAPYEDSKIISNGDIEYHEHS